MPKTLNIGIAAAAVWFAVADDLRAGPPETLTAGGAVQQAADGTSPIGAFWRAYAAGASAEQADGAVGATLPGIWTGDIGMQISGLGVGTDCIAVVSREAGTGTIGHTGYYAVINHILTSEDPAVFPPMTLRPIPVPAVTTDACVHLAWSNAAENTGEGGIANIVGYNIYRGVDGINFSRISTSIVTQTFFTDTIPIGSGYYYALGLVYRGSPNVTSAVLSANSPCVFINGPGTPGSLSAGDGTDAGGIQVVWSATTNVQHYELWRSTNISLAAAICVADSITNLYYYDAMVDPGLIRHYWVRAVSAAGNAGDFSLPDSGWRYLPPPTGFAAGKGAETNKVALTWNSSSGAFHYEIWRSLYNNTNTAIKLATLDAAVTQYDDITGAPVIKYYYWISACTPDMCNFSAPDIGWRADPEQPFLPVPTGVSASEGLYADKVHVVWNAVNGATAYEIWRDLAAPLSSEKIGETTATSYEDMNVQPGTLYTYRIKARNTLAMSGFSAGAIGWRRGIQNGIIMDYDGDGLADPAMYEETTANWTILMSGGGYARTTFYALLGGPGWDPVPGDYDGDGLADPAVYQDTTGNWTVMLSSRSYSQMPCPALLGSPGWAVASADYDGDSRTDFAVYQEAGGNWEVKLSSADYSSLALSAFLGGAGNTAIPNDYDGDGLADPAVYTRADGTWEVLLSSANYTSVVIPHFLGGVGWDPVPGDYDGDGLADPAVRKFDGSEWRFKLSNSGYGLVEVPLGL